MSSLQSPPTFLNIWTLPIFDNDVGPYVSDIARDKPSELNENEVPNLFAIVGSCEVKTIP